MSTFKKELVDLINRYSKENGSDTPDFILADYLIESLKNFDKIVKRRDEWYFDVSNKPLDPEAIRTTVITEAKATLGEDKKVTKEDILSKKVKDDNILSDELIKSKIMLIYDYVNRKFVNDKSYFNDAKTQKWVLEKFIDVIKIFNLSPYIHSVVCDDRNNTPEVIDHNELVVDITFSMYINGNGHQHLTLIFPDKPRL